MKYLYKILRLFFCPHKFDKTLRNGNLMDCGSVVGHYYNKQCQYCGSVKKFSC